MVMVVTGVRLTGFMFILPCFRCLPLDKMYEPGRDYHQVGIFASSPPARKTINSLSD